MPLLNDSFLNALKCKNEGRPPVWLMRQAGRYLPEYRALRKNHSLRELFFTPGLAAEITKMPIDLLGVDAAILFSDITVVALPLGLELDFCEGPVVTGKGKPQSLEPIEKTIQILKKDLKVPLIGFCGGPYTVSTYLNAPLQDITDVTIDYLKMQEKAGVDAIQIFDSWANALSKEDFSKICLPYLKQLVEAVNVPVILFMRNAKSRLDELLSINPNCISFDGEIPDIPIAVQGNLDPDLLFEPLPTIQQKVEELLTSMKGNRGFIVNLGHGVKPNTPVEAVRCLIETVHRLNKNV